MEEKMHSMQKAFWFDTREQKPQGTYIIKVASLWFSQTFSSIIEIEQILNTNVCNTERFKNCSSIFLKYHVSLIKDLGASSPKTVKFAPK